MILYYQLPAVLALLVPPMTLPVTSLVPQSNGLCSDPGRSHSWQQNCCCYAYSWARSNPPVRPKDGNFGGNFKTWGCPSSRPNHAFHDRGSCLWFADVVTVGSGLEGCHVHRNWESFYRWECHLDCLELLLELDWCKTSRNFVLFYIHGWMNTCLGFVIKAFPLERCASCLLLQVKVAHHVFESVVGVCNVNSCFNCLNLPRVAHHIKEHEIHVLFIPGWVSFHTWELG